MKRPLIIGHKGAPEHELGNTLPSFKRAIEIGVDMIELDVQETKDAVLVVFHDWDLSNLSASDAVIGEMACADIQDIELQGGYRIPTLDEVLDLAQGKTMVDIDIKGFDLGEKALQSVKSHDMVNDVLFTSFYHPQLQRIRELEPEAEIGLLYSNPLEKPASYTLELNAQVIAPLIDLFYPALVAQAHNVGLKVIPWTVNSTDIAVELARLGVDGIITDVPDVFLSMYQKMDFSDTRDFAVT